MHSQPDIQHLLSQMHHQSLQPIEPGLERIHALLSALDNPEKKLPPVIHIAGTNGKGSVCAYLTAILQQAGLRVHRYTSPHLVRFNERIMLADEEIPDADLLKLLMRLQPLIVKHPATFYEATTALAMLAFAEMPADICILETGMGGKWDATNVVANPLLTILTPISMDHMDFLGNTIADIAGEKAGIIKQNVPCMVGKQPPEELHVLRQTAAAKHAPIKLAGEDWQRSGADFSAAGAQLTLKPSLAGMHQLDNAALAAAASLEISSLLPEMRITHAHIQQGISQAVWPARLQLLNATHALCQILPGSNIWLDGGHNADAAEQLAEWLKQQNAPMAVVCGMIVGKDSSTFIKCIAPCASRFIAVDGFSEAPLAQSKHHLAELAQAFTQSGEAEHIAQAMSALADAGFKGNVLICGSLYLAGHVLAMH